MDINTFTTITESSRLHALRVGKHEIRIEDEKYLGSSRSFLAYSVYGTAVRSDCADLVGKKVSFMFYTLLPLDPSLNFDIGNTIAVETFAKPMRRGGKLLVTWLGRRG